MIEMFMLLLFGHFLADYPLQGEFIAHTKNRYGVAGDCPWYQAMLAHVVIHGSIVWLITGAWVLGLAEAAAHAVIDDAKCARRISFNQDQALHIVLKLVWAAVAGYLA